MPLRDKNVILSTGIVFLAFLTLLSLAYLPLLTSGFLFHDDFTSLFWNRKSLDAHPYWTNMLTAGRWVAQFLIPLEQYWLTTHTSPYIRFVGIVLLSIMSGLNLYWLRKLEYSMVASFVLTVALATLPPFQSCVFNLTSEFIIFSSIVAQISAIYMIKCLDLSDSKTIQAINCALIAIVFLLIGQFTYVSGTGYFLVFILLYALAPGTELDRPLIRRCYGLVAIYFVSLLIYYAGTLLRLHLMHMEESHDLGRGLSVNHDVLGQLWFYITIIVPKTLNFWYIFQDSSAKIVITLIAFCASVWGVKELLLSKPVSHSQDKLKLYTAVIGLLIFIIPLSAAFPLAAVPGRFVPYRTLSAHMVMLFILTFWGIACAGKRIIKKYRHAILLELYAGVAVIAFALVSCCFMLERYVVRPMNLERDFIRGVLVSHHIQPEDKYINIALRKDTSRCSFIKEGGMDSDGWGISVTCFYWSAPLVTIILQDMGVDVSELIFTAENHAQWPKGQITILVKPQDKVPEGAVIVDMHDLFTLSNGL